MDCAETTTNLQASVQVQSLWEYGIYDGRRDHEMSVQVADTCPDPWECGMKAS